MLEPLKYFICFGGVPNYVQNTKLGLMVFFYIILLFVLLLSEYDEYPFLFFYPYQKERGLDGEKGVGEDKIIPIVYIFNRFLELES